MNMGAFCTTTVLHEHQLAHALRSCRALSPRHLSQLLAHYGTYTQVYQASSIPEYQAAGLDEPTARAIAAHCASADPSALWEQLLQQQISLLLPEDDAWPALLQEIAHPPRMLYVRGMLPHSETLYLAMVGTRKITTYGRTVVLDLVPPLAAHGVVLVSGMAFGIDAAVHEAVVRAHKPTVAVLGSGLDERSLYPKAHALLADTIIAAGGGLISEYPPGTPALKQHFIARNRIIAGMCQGTVIVECDLHSGSLSTTNYALEQGRRVFAVPGPIYSPGSRGTNNLLKLGATPVTNAQDIFVDLNLPTTSVPEESTPHPVLNPHEQQILDILTKTPLLIDELIIRSGMNAQQCRTTLTFLELKGLAKNLGAGQYIRI